MAVFIILFIPVEDPESPSIQGQASPTKTTTAESIDSAPNDDRSTTADSNSIQKSENPDSPEKSVVVSEESNKPDPNSLPGDEQVSETEDVKVAERRASEGEITLTEVTDAREDSERRIQWSIGEEQSRDVTLDRFTLEQVLQWFLDDLGIGTDVWEKTDDGNQWKVSLMVESSYCDHVLHRLTNFGFGRIAETSISILAATTHYTCKASTDGQDGREVETSDKFSHGKSEKNEFIRSRLTVAQVVDGVSANAQLTFDYIVLVILASMIASLGLAEDSSVVLVASMLVSPIMGPIMGGVFGIVIRHRDLWKLGVKNELIGLALCLLVGFLVGLLMAGFSMSGANWGSTDSWPTAEMKSRGMLRSLWVGVLIALPSGAGVALSLMGGNSGSLVGVAISASLLPPAVNSGMLWALALLSSITHPAVESLSMNKTNSSLPQPPNCPPLQDNEYEFIYSCSLPKEAGLLGLISIILTLLNIICIFTMGILVLKIKEVAPHTAVSSAREAFWKTDLKVARGVYKTMKTGQGALDLAKAAQDIAVEWKNKQKDEDRERRKQSLHDFVKLMENDTKYQAAVFSVPGVSLHNSMLKAFEREGDLALVDQALPRDRSYHTISTLGHFRQLLKVDTVTVDNEEKQTTDTTSSNPVSPQVPLTPDPGSADKRFVFDQEKVLRRRKNPRHPRGPHRMMSSPAVVVVPPSKCKIKRFEVETINEETPLI